MPSVNIKAEPTEEKKVSKEEKKESMEEKRAPRRRRETTKGHYHDNKIKFTPEEVKKRLLNVLVGVDEKQLVDLPDLKDNKLEKECKDLYADRADIQAKLKTEDDGKRRKALREQRQEINKAIAIKHANSILAKVNDKHLTEEWDSVTKGKIGWLTGPGWFGRCPSDHFNKRYYEDEKTKPKTESTRTQAKCILFFEEMFCSADSERNCVSASIRFRGMPLEVCKGSRDRFNGPNIVLFIRRDDYKTLKQVSDAAEMMHQSEESKYLQYCLVPNPEALKDGKLAYTKIEINDDAKTASEPVKKSTGARGQDKLEKTQRKRRPRARLISRSPSPEELPERIAHPAYTVRPPFKNWG